MAEAYVLINCDLGSEDSVIKQLKKLSRVAEVKGVFGVYDVIARVRADTESDIKKVVSNVRTTDGIKSSLTMMVIEGQGD